MYCGNAITCKSTLEPSIVVTGDLVMYVVPSLVRVGPILVRTTYHTT